MGVEQHTLETVGRRHQATLIEQRNLGGRALTTRIENLDENWADDGITSDAAKVYTIGPGSIPRDVVPLVFDSGPIWPR
jgi:hypothetical protein